MFGELRASIELKISSYSRMLVDVESVEKVAKEINYFDDMINKYIGCECQRKILVATTHA